jgi:putative nucleotidyltransferase with HDIG domain
MLPAPSSSSGRELLPTWLHDGLVARVANPVGLPVLPDTACRVMAACQDERSDLRELARLVTHDQALAAHVLRVANSVAYAPKAPITSLQQALGRLGLSTVSDIALAVAIKQRVFAVPGYEARIRALWLHSTAAACYAQDVAKLLGRDGEAAFLCGLLHDVGMPLVMQGVCDLARERGEGNVAPETMEAAMLAFHAELGAAIAARWRLGPLVSAAIAYHHEPFDGGHLREDVLVVTLADALADWAPDESKTAQDFAVAAPLPAAAVNDAHVLELLQARGRILELARAFQ